MVTEKGDGGIKNSPGGVSTTGGSCHGARAFTDSVDGGDRNLDGFRRSGGSFFSGLTNGAPSFIFEFDEVKNLAPDKEIWRR